MRAQRTNSAARVALRMLRKGWGVNVAATSMYLKTLDEAGVTLDEAGGFYCLTAFQVPR